MYRVTDLHDAHDNMHLCILSNANLLVGKKYAYTHSRLVEQVKQRQIDFLKRVMEISGLTLSGVAAKAGVAQTTITRFFNDETNKVTELSARTLDKVARVIGFDSYDAYIAGGTRTRMVPIVGKVGAGGHIFPIDDLPLLPDSFSSGGSGRIQPMPEAAEYVEAPPGVSPTEPLVAVRVRGDSMFPVYRDGDVIYYSRRVEGNLDELIGKRCVVKIKEGFTAVKELQRYGQPGRYNLFSYNAPLIEGVEIDWAAKITFTKQD